jgi:hypothetical protein
MLRMKTRMKNRYGVWGGNERGRRTEGDKVRGYG